MNRTSPRIGYNQFIHLEWIVKALEIRAGLADPESLDDLFSRTCTARTARTGSTTMLNRMWLNPPENLEPLANRATEIFRSVPDIPPAAFAYGMAMAAYPFFTEAATIIGRQSSLYRDFSPAIVCRRMAEIYGESDSNRNAVNMTLKSLINWGLLEHESDSRMLVQPPPLPLDNPDILHWMTTAILSATDRPLVVESLGLHPLLHSFELHEHFRFILLNAREFDIYPDSNGNNLIYPGPTKPGLVVAGKTERQAEFIVEQIPEPDLQGPEF